MKTVQWLALTLVLLLVAELLIVPEGADGWGRRRRRRRRRWLSRRRSSSRRRRSWLRKAGRAIGRGFKKVGRAIVRGARVIGKGLHKIATSKIVGRISTVVGFANSFIGTACCVTAVTPITAGCCIASRGIAGGLCGLGAYRTVNTLRTRARGVVGNAKKYGSAALSAHGAIGNCKQAITGVSSTPGNVKKAWTWGKRLFGRKKRSTESDSSAEVKCGAKFLSIDIAKLKMMTCAIMELKSKCARYDSTKRNVLAKVVFAIKVILAQALVSIRKPSLIKALKDTKCRTSKFLPICAPRSDEATATSFGTNSGRYDPSREPCRLVSRNERRLSRKTCASRQAYSMMHLQKFTMLIVGDVAKMYPSQVTAKAAGQLADTIKKTVPEGR